MHLNDFDVRLEKSLHLQESNQLPVFLEFAVIYKIGRKLLNRAGGKLSEFRLIVGVNLLGKQLEKRV
jgi:hypothetical protein